MDINNFVYWLLVVTSILSMSGMLSIAYGYRWSLFNADKATRYFAWWSVLVATVYFWRRLSWDIIQPWMTGIYAQDPLINILFNVLSLIAIFCGLKARYYLIPEEEQPQWHWWNSWVHPNLFDIRPERNDDGN